MSSNKKAEKGDGVQRISESSEKGMSRTDTEGHNGTGNKKQSFFSIFRLVKAADKSTTIVGATDQSADDHGKRHPVPSIIKLMKGRKKQLFHINEAGEFVDNIFREHTANVLYSQIIGRGVVDRHTKKTFVRADIACEGHLFKQGSWFKTWKKRYFILRKDIKSLCYFPSKDDLTLLGSVKLDNDVVVDLVDDGDKVDELLVLRKVSTNSILLCMKSENANDKNKWRFEIESELYAIHHHGGHSTETNDPSIANYNALWWESVFSGSRILEAHKVSTNHEHQSVDLLAMISPHVAACDDGGDADAEAISSVKPLQRDKSKKFRHPPIKEEYIQSYIDNGTNLYSGFQVSLRLNYLLFNHDLVYTIIFGSKSQAPMINGEIDSMYVSNKDEWTMLCHTEVHSVEQEDQVVLIPSYIVRFTLLQELFTKSGYLNIKVVVMLLSSNITQDKLNTAQSKVNQRVISTLVFQTAALQSSPIQASMMVCKNFQRHIEQSAPVEIPKGVVEIGFVSIKSVVLMQQQAEIRKFFCVSPYAQRFYSFPCVSGQTMSNEVIFASDFGVQVARSLSKLICDERSIAINHIKTGILQDIKNIVSDKDFISAFSHKNMSLVDLDADAMILLHRKESLDRALATIDEIVNDLLGKPPFFRFITSCTYYFRPIECKLDVLKLCIELLNNEVENNVIDVKVGGSLLRRSVWKKLKEWQYITTNLNIHLMLSQHVPEKELFNEEAVFSNKFIHVIPSITLGVPAAHSLKYNHGGLRRLFNNIDDLERRLLWMLSMQLSLDDGPLEQMIAKYPKDAKVIFGSSLKAREGDNAYEKSLFTHKRYDLAKRIDICSSQVLGFAVTAVKLCIHLATSYNGAYFDSLARALRIGLLVSLQSMLSTFGDELGMIEDLDFAASWLNLVTIRLVNHIPGRDKVNIMRDSTKRYIVDVEIDPSEGATVVNAVNSMSDYVVKSNDLCESGSSSIRYSSLAPKLNEVLKEGITLMNALKFKPTIELDTSHHQTWNESGLKVYGMMHLVGVTFTQGVNEMQSLAHISNHSDVQRQVDINDFSLRRIKQYHVHFVDAFTFQFRKKEKKHLDAEVDAASSLIGALRTQKSTKPRRALNNKTTSAMIEATRTLDNVSKILEDAELALSKASCAKGEKHVHVLIKSSEFCRSVGGVVGILCKSGKDRTAMGVTLDISKSLVEELGVLQGKDVCQILRSSGVRTMNVFANTGQPMYAFNELQRIALPVCFRPPPSTYSGSVNS